MTWLLLILLCLAAIVLAPLLREALRKTMGSEARALAPGEFASLSRGVTHYRWIGPRRGPVAVCVHGLTTPSFVWGDQSHGLATGLADRGFRVLCYDLYGRGFSDRPVGLQNRNFFVDQLQELLDHQDVPGDFVLIGYSMGGAIATAYASAHPDRVRELVLLATAGLKTNSGRLATFIRSQRPLGDWLMMALYPRLHIRGTEAERSLTSSVPDIVDLQQAELTYKGFVPAVLSSLRGILNEDMGPDLRHIHRQGVPILAIWGEADDVVPVSSVGRLTEQARSARQEVISDAGHGLPYTHTKEVLAILDANHRRGLE